MNFEEKNINVLNALNNNTISVFNTTEIEDELIRKAIKKDAAKFLVRTFLASIISAIVLVLLIFIHKAILEKIGFVFVRYIIFIIPIIGVFSPFAGIYNLFNKNKLANNKKYKCYIGIVEQYVENKFGYKIYGLNIESIDFLLGYEPKDKLKQNDKVIILSMNDSCYLIDINKFNNN